MILNLLKVLDNLSNQLAKVFQLLFSWLTLRQAQDFASTHMRWFTYILLCNQKTYYVGLTHNLAQRLNSHLNKENIGTKQFSDLKMVYHEEFKSRKEAESREKQLKGWTAAKKRALIEGDTDLLKRLSKS